MITIKRGDTGIGLKATLSNNKGNVDLTDASVLFLLDEHEINAEINNAENGEVAVFFDAAHTEKTGFFNTEFEVWFSDGRVETFPNDGYVKLRIMQDKGGVS